MKMTAKIENALTLAAALGISEQEATEKLVFSALITATESDRNARIVAAQLKEMLSRTITSVEEALNTMLPPAVEIVIGGASPRSSAPTIYISINSRQIVVAKHRQEHDEHVLVHRVLLLLGACYGVGAALSAALGEKLSGGLDKPIIIDFQELLGVPAESLDEPIQLGEAYIAGAGAVANGFLWALREFNVHGVLHIVDPDKVSDGNLNRNIWFTLDDLGKFKSERLADRVQPFLGDLCLVPHATTLAKVPAIRKDGQVIRRLIVTVDSPRARRSLQTEIPGEVFDASTTGIAEVVFHHHRQPNDGACLSCIYAENPDEFAHEKHVADQLGVTLKQVKEAFVTEEAAKKIFARYPDISPETISGQAYDSLFKHLCGAHALKTATDRQVLAPFCFVSVLAGAYLALETVLRVLTPVRSKEFNYWRASSWASPLVQLRRYRSRRSDCEFCGNEQFRTVAEKIWGDAYSIQDATCGRSARGAEGVASGREEPIRPLNSGEDF